MEARVIPWQTLDTAVVPQEDRPLVLLQRGPEFAIRLGTQTLMSSLDHGSEELLAERVCERLAARDTVRVLIGGLGMGFTLAAALRTLGDAATVEVAELVPAVVAWNRGPLAHLAGKPLADARVTVREEDVAARIQASRATYDAILLDVDNGPEGLTCAANDALYATAGLRAAFAALRPGGILGVWSVAPDLAFTQRLQKARFVVEVAAARAKRTKGGRHTLWLATRLDAGVS